MGNEICELPTQNIKSELINMRNGIVKENQLCLPVLHSRQIEGDRKKGLITHYAQTHAMLDEKDGTSCLTKPAEQIIIESQKQIFKSLILDNPDIVFVEGFIGNNVPLKGDIEYIFNDEKWNRIIANGNQEKVLKEYGFKTRDEAKDSTFYSLGGAIVYEYLHKKKILGVENINLLRKAREEVLKKLNVDELTCQKILEGKVKIGERDVFNSDTIMKDREKSALNIIRRWIGENPGKKAALVFGSDHDFSQEYFKIFGSKGPTLHRTDYPSSVTRLFGMPKEDITKSYK